MVDVVYVHLIVSIAALFAVATTLFPIRVDPLTGPAFVTGWLVGELAAQGMIVLGILIAFFEWVHAGRGVLGHLASALDTLSMIGLLVLFGAGLRSRKVVARELAHTPGFPLDVDAIAGHARWARWWRSLLAAPFPGRHVEVIKDLAYSSSRARRRCARDDLRARWRMGDG